MDRQSLSRDEAEKEYNKFKMNPNDYALEKGEEYYASLGYKSLMDGVITEAEKDGRGDEVRERISKFKRDSQLKAYAVIGTVIVLFLAAKLQYEADPSFFNK
ncbi:hypothetical protein TrCOL_g1587 [Triparma columacea]|uniref:Uncharacterized protein n=1 Tax=Triparma columacea TaxID=722753 RepID=A0A9W7GK11_9STRA|nr:hypothetical protein TrCOL_g1587 [Triparma columacea]